MILKILNEVYQQKMSDNTETAHKSFTWRSSSLGSCLRGQFLSRLLSGDFKVQHDRRTLNVFELGNIIEDKVIADLKQHKKYLVITQGEMHDPTLNLSGHFDMLVIELATGKPHMGECKSKSSRAFTYMDKKGQGAMGHHRMQCHSYICMCNDYGFALPDKENNMKNPAFVWLTKNADTIGWKEIVDPEVVTTLKRLNPTASAPFSKPIFKLRQQITEGSIIYISKDDQRELEYPVFLNDKTLRDSYVQELKLLNDAWNNHSVLQENEKGAWQTKYCQYCQAGLCEKLDSKEVVDALFETVAQAEKERELEQQKKDCTHEIVHMGKCAGCGESVDCPF